MTGAVSRESAGSAAHRDGRYLIPTVSLVRLRRTLRWSLESANLNAATMQTHSELLLAVDDELRQRARRDGTAN